MGEGIVLLGLGWWGYQKRSATLFYIAFGLLLTNGVFTLVSLAEAGCCGGLDGFFLRFFICVLVFRGARAAQELKSAAAGSALAA